MLGSQSDDFVALRAAGPGNSFNGQVVRLRGARREDDFLRAGVDQVGHLPARRLYCRLGLPAEFVIAAGGVAAGFAEIRKHCLKHPGVHGRRGVVIHVDGEFHANVPSICADNPGAGTHCRFAFCGA